MSKSAAYERSMMLRTPSKGSKAAPWQVLDNPAAFYNDDPKMRPVVDQAQAQAYGKTGGASPEPEPEPEPAPFIAEGVPTPLKARTKELARNSRTLPLTPRRDEQSGPYPLTAAARQHVRNLFALGRDVDNMLDKFGLEPASPSHLPPVQAKCLAQTCCPGFCSLTVLVPVLVMLLLLLLPRKATYESPAPPAVPPSVSIAVTVRT